MVNKVIFLGVESPHAGDIDDEMFFLLKEIYTTCNELTVSSLEYDRSNVLLLSINKLYRLLAEVVC